MLPLFNTLLSPGTKKGQIQKAAHSFSLVITQQHNTIRPE